MIDRDRGISWPEKKAEIERVIATIRDSMNRDIPKWESLFDLKEDMKTAVEVHTRGHDSMNPRVLPLFQGNRIRDRIYQRLGHIIISSQSPENFEALRQAYVYPDDTSSPPPCVNDGGEATKSFLNDLTKQAQKCREIMRDGNYDMVSQLNAAAGFNWIWLHGKKGIGKTFFLNHFFAKYRAELEKEQLMWIRMDLWRKFGDDCNLRHRVYSQATKIAFRYFHVDSVKRVNPGVVKFTYDDEVGVRELLASSAAYKDLADDFDELVKNIKGRFVDEKINRPVDPRDIPFGLGKEFFKKIFSKNYVPLLVFDGFDRLESTSEHRERFMALRQGMTELREDPEFLGAVILVVSRTATVEALKREGWGRMPGRTYSLIEKHIRSVRLEVVVDQRIEVVKTEIEKRMKSQANGIDWIEKLDEFKTFAVEKLEEETEAVCGALDKIHYTNTRAKMQSLQLLWYEFLKKNELEDEQRSSSNAGLRSYKLVEALMIAGRLYPPVHYKYNLSEDSRLDRGLGNNLFDFHLLPSIFSFPFARDSADDVQVSFKLRFPKETHGFLAGLRMLQLVWSHDYLMDYSRKRGELLRAHELVKLCKTLFNYEEDLVINLIEEFGQFDLLSLIGEHSAVAHDPRNLLIIPQQKTGTVLETLIGEVSYLNLCAMNTLLSSKAFKGRQPVFEAVASRSEGRNKMQHVRQWTHAKMRNSIQMFRVARHWNRLQESNFNGRVKRIEGNKRLWKTAIIAKEGLEGKTGMFQFTENMAVHMIDQFGVLLSALDLNTIISTRKMLETYFTKCDLFS